MSSRMCGLMRIDRLRNEVDGVKRACAKREIGLEDARELCLDRVAWRSMKDRIV